ncbi:MAG TPA: excinuclease ATPase subunit [Albitalea sp.]|nr:excinuclease ATPase subunit [Albitalea sp.]
MKKSLIACLIAATLAAPALARNTEYKLNLADVLNSSAAKARLDSSVVLYFGDNTMPAGAERKGEDVMHRIAKGDRQNDDLTACMNAAVDALVGLQTRAKQLGANAVVNIVSYYKNNTFSSATQYECHAGGTGGHLSLRAVYAVVPKN